jgi:hypothetical protein
MPFGFPVTPGEVVKAAANNSITGNIDRAVAAANAGDTVGAAQGFFQATAVAAAYAVGTLWGFSKYPVAGLDQALRNLANKPGIYELVLANLLPRLGIVQDPLVINRLANIAKSFAGGAAAAYLTNEGINFVNSLNIGGNLYDLIHSDVNTDYTAARGWTAPRDPLVLDLDGDGIETVGIDPLAPILFDHDADGVKTGTGWIKSDDGLLVIDVNGNGTIDSGRELFGDNSLLYTALDGPVYAADGYAALRAQDSNSDGVVNSLDANFNQLRVWRDLNQDGISQAGELQTLSQAGIASIGVTGTATNTNLGNGNTQVASGSFTRINGTAGQTGVAELTGSQECYVFSSFLRKFELGCRHKSTSERTCGTQIIERRTFLSTSAARQKVQIK